MNFIKLLPVIVSMLLLGAHFFRAGYAVLVLGFAVMPLLLLIRRPWVPWLIRTVLILGGIEWFRTLMVFKRLRQAVGMPWERLALILGGVAVFTVCSALVFRFSSLRQRYKP